jgi:hypothetical protein
MYRSTSWRRVVSFMPRPLYARERAPGSNWIGGWVDPRAGLDDLQKKKYLTLTGLELYLGKAVALFIYLMTFSVVQIRYVASSGIIISEQ